MNKARFLPAGGTMIFKRTLPRSTTLFSISTDRRKRFRHELSQMTDKIGTSSFYDQDGDESIQTSKIILRISTTTKYLGYMIHGRKGPRGDGL